MKVLQEKLELILKAEDRDNSFFFEGNDEEMVSPKVMIAGKAVPLDRLKYDL